MSYIPDYRTRNNYGKLGEDTQEYLSGYHQAIADLTASLFGVECFEDFGDIPAELLDRLEGRFDEDEQKSVIGAILSEVGTIANINEREAWCGLVESDPSVPEDYEPEDLDGGPYIFEENKRRKGEPMFSDEDYGYYEQAKEGTEE